MHKTLSQLASIDLPRMRPKLTASHIAAAGNVGGIDPAMLKAAKLARNQNRRHKTTIEPIHVLGLLSASSWRCFYCGTPKGLNLTLDHIVPLCRGGSNSYRNLVPCCEACQWLKSYNDERLGAFLTDIGISFGVFDFRHRLLLYAMTMLS